MTHTERVQDELIKIVCNTLLNSKMYGSKLYWSYQSWQCN